jgi:hypothetical protein
MTEAQQLPSQSPGRQDYQAAAALYLHQFNQDTLGWNLVVQQARESQRLAQLLVALIEIGGQAPEPLNSPAGIAGLKAVATGMAVDDPPPS